MTEKRPKKRKKLAKANSIPTFWKLCFYETFFFNKMYILFVICGVSLYLGLISYACD
eukprot:Pgem_evm1s2442